MHLGPSYKVSEFIVWTRRHIYLLLVVGVVPVVLYQVLGLRWLSLPLTVVGLLGTATSFIVGFKNVQTYNRSVEAQQLWSDILGTTRYWGTSVRNFAANPSDARDLVGRHLAWLGCLRYELRSPRPWETVQKAARAEYGRRYNVAEHEVPLAMELRPHIGADELRQVRAAQNKPIEILWLQGRALKRLMDEARLSPAFYMELNKLLKESIEQLGRAERLKNFPYPRQYAIINTIFVWAFCALLPFGLLQEFDKLNQGISGVMQGFMVWLVVPFSATISWMYTALEQVGESTENPFEGGANDVPITHLSKIAERELLQLFGEPAPRALPQGSGDIVL